MRKIEQRLTSYWRLEALNILFVPAMMLWLAGGNVGAISWIAILAMSLLLAIGAYYWRAKLMGIQSGEALKPSIERIGRLELPAALLTAVSAVIAVAAWIEPSLSAGLADRIVASCAAGLAVLEYVNYYHRQLQHFDHAADFRRLLEGRGFRKSQLRSDLERFGLR